VLFVSDGSTDDTVPLIRSHLRPGWSLQELSARSGKAAALNAGLHAATGDLLVFTDAAIELRPDALRRIVQPFTDPAVGCVSGEDRIADAGGEGLYGRYELLLRRLESRVHSIVGASGSFYAQRRSLCRPFTEGMAPDFLSVLRTVAQGYRALSEESAVGSMTSLKDPRQEFDRKVRTLIRGMTTLFAHPDLLNPFRYGAFAFALWSHKVMRWLAPFFMLIAFAASLALLDRPLYLAAAIAQVLVYGVALLAWYEVAGVGATLPGRIALYFVNVNAAVVAAWFRYARGVRQEIWTPSRRA
jgi:cellulose synthase/poly-beta-1,6-N-acetylglucosamine synthase-like glycosyltransferase